MSIDDKILQIANSAKKLTSVVAGQIVQTWLDQFPLEQSFRSKFRKHLVAHDDDNEDRYYIRRTSLVVERRVRTSGRWSTWSEASSRPVIEEALKLLDIAVSSDPAPAIVAKYARDLARSRNKAETEKNTGKGTLIAIKEFASNHYDEFFKLLREGRKVDPEIITKIKTRGEFYGSFIFKAGRVSLSDDAFVSIDKPPFLPMYRRTEYFWIENIGGVDYSFFFSTYEKGKMLVRIIADYHRHTMPRSTIEGVIADTGAIDYGMLDKPKMSSLIATMTRMQVAGVYDASIVSLWCRIMNSFGIKQSMIVWGDRDTLDLLKNLEEAGKIKVEGVEGRTLMIRCVS